ncbi:trimethylamine methyltransferase family protein [Thermovenabulum sp.]|uniref:trimethylamine methyltransferase family protein n=1 Tax=Thermovenabulum sp. TaxID=3100335 RepID=UPI003C7E5EB9
MLYPAEFKYRMSMLNSKEIEMIHQASLEILQRTGVYMPLKKERLEVLKEYGITVKEYDKRIYFPPRVVEEALSKAPKSYTLYARNPEYDLPLDGQHGYLSLDGCGVHVVDLETGQVRKSTREDLARAAKVADFLPQISFLWPCVSALDCTPSVQPLYELKTLFENSSKHIQVMTAVDPLNAKGSVEIAASVAGGRDALRRRPIISNFQCSVSPLCFEEKSMEAAFIFAEAGIPVGIMTMPMGGATAPITVAGNMAVSNAEILAGITVLELLYPGTPTFYGSCATMMDLRTAQITCGAPEDFLMQAAICEMAHYYKIPACVGTFATGAKTFNWQSGVENSISCAVSVWSGADMICGAGMLNGATIFSFEQLLMDCEIFEIIRRVFSGAEVNAETLGLDVINKVGPGNNFLIEKHTIKFARKTWMPSLIQHKSYEDWVRNGKPSPEGIAKEKVLTILNSHQPLPLNNTEELNEIIDYYEHLSRAK